MRSVLLIGLGAILMIGAVTGFVIVPEHKPPEVAPGDLSAALSAASNVGWSQTTYDAARIGTWALLIVGALLVALGLINFARR